MRRKACEKTDVVSSLYEYAFVPVPQNQRKKSMGVFYVLTGYTSALSCLVIGSKIGAALPFWQAIAACFLGDLVLILIGTSMGILSSKTGWSTAFLSQKVLGKSVSVIFSLLIIVCSVFWIGINGSLFTTMLISVFPLWPVPAALTSLGIIAVWALSATYGWNGLEISSRVVVPCSLSLLLYAMVQLFIKMGGVTFLFAVPTSVPMTFSAASTAIIGNYVFGCIITPDTCRFAKSPRNVVLVCPCAYAVGLFLFNVCGVVVAKAGGFSDFIRSTAAVGLIVPMLLCSIFCLATTQNINAYGGSLAIQNVFQGTSLEGNVSHKVTVFLIAGLAAALSVSGIGTYLIPVVSSFAIFMVPFPGMLLGEFFFLGDRKPPKAIQWSSILIWAIGSLSGIFFLSIGWPIAPLWEMIFSGLLYVAWGKWVGTKCTARA
ncbi:MAG: cytosine permease [Oscillospiraceae bacterium]